MLIPSISTDILNEWPPDEAIRLFGEAGFPCVEFGFGHEKAYLEGREDEGAMLRRIRKAAERAGVRILQMHGRLCNFCADGAEENIAWAHRSLRRGAALGAQWVVLHPGTVEGIGADPDLEAWTRQRNLEIFTGFLRTAEEVGTGVAVENMIGGRRGRRFGAAIGDLVWLVDQLDSKRVGICWDTGHAELSRVPQEAGLRAVGSRLVALHIDDNDGEQDRHWAPFRGQVDWSAVMTALRSIGYRGPFNFELPGEGKATPAEVKPEKLRYLRALADVLTGQVAAEAADVREPERAG